MIRVNLVVQRPGEPEFEVEHATPAQLREAADVLEQLGCDRVQSMFGWFARIERKLDTTISLLHEVLRRESVMAGTLADIERDVEDESTVIGSVEVMVTNILAELKAAVAANDPVRLQAIFDKIEANKTRLGALVASNTAATKTTTEPVTVPAPQP